MNSPTSKKPMTKTEMIAALAGPTGLTKKQVVSLLDELAKLIESAISIVYSSKYLSHFQN